ncbi:GNAT family N-acetyltransferase [Brevibacillus sp. SYSU BS000544]|uniref:GNAT family N-acetyltransferase n=1 Tax=Brevibacillus sp. SYSU BS000544 TaxID=3416443 RepID=UPI003CE5A332
MQKIAPVSLEGHYVRLEPLSLDHLEDLWISGQDEKIWQYMTIPMKTRDDMGSFIRTALSNQEEAKEVPFAIIDKQTNRAIGSTRFLNISYKDKGLEIGFTWLTPSVWKTAVNTECKWLLLRYCFEQLGCIRVQLKTDLRNLNSQRAIARIGGVKEGILRNHMMLPSGYIRDTVFFSILDSEWPEVNKKLHQILLKK